MKYCYNWGVGGNASPTQNHSLPSPGAWRCLSLCKLLEPLCAASPPFLSQQTCTTKQLDPLSLQTKKASLAIYITVENMEGKNMLEMY